MWSNDKNFPARGFCTPQPAWKKTHSAIMPMSERKRISPVNNGDLFHVIHKVPAGDSPYGRAKHVQLIDKDPSRAISLFWAAINAGDRVDSSLKDMAVVMKQLDRSDEAIEAIKSFRHLCSYEAQESLDNVLIELYKRSGRIEEEIEMLQNRLKNIEEGIAFGGKRTKTARSQGKKVLITIEQEKARIFGNLAWAFLQQHNYGIAEQHYRKALSLDPDRNKQCNLAVCLLHMRRIAEAKALLQEIRDSCGRKQMDESYAKSFERAIRMLCEIESQSTPEPVSQEPDKRKEIQRFNATSENWRSSHESPCERPGYWGNSTRQGVTSACQRTYASPAPGKRNAEGLLTQPRRGSWRFTNVDQRGGWGEDAVRSSVRKLQFDQTITTENLGLHSTQNLNGDPLASQNEKPGLGLQKSAVALPSPTREDWRRSWSDVAKVKEDEAVEYLRQPGKGEGNDRYAQVENREKKHASGVLLTQPRNILSRPQNGNQKWARWEENTVGGSIHNLSFEHTTTELSHSSQNLVGEPVASTNEKSETGLEISAVVANKKSWADMVEEEEEMLSGKGPSTKFDGFNCEEEFNDENLNSNIIYQKPLSQNQIGTVRQMLESLDIKGGKSAPLNAVSSRRNRLPVFQDITILSESP
ncbi:hypothetical protein SLE2022_338880 [Rubroshorea leprosula]